MKSYILLRYLFVIIIIYKNKVISFKNSIHNSEIIQFLSNNYTFHEWFTIKSILHCLTTNGYWHLNDKIIHNNSFYPTGLLYTSPCYDGRYVLNKCHLDTLYSNMKGLNYIWKNNKLCKKMDIKSYNRTHMCELINNKNILLLGDSIQDEFFYTLDSALIQSHSCRNSNEYINSINTIFEFNGNISYQVIDTSKFNCGNSKLYVIRHDHFIIREFGDSYTSTIHAQEQLYGTGWHYLLKKLNINLIIANRGVHYVPDDIVLVEIQETFSYLYKYHNDISIIYRSSSPGHVNFNEMRYSIPLINETQASLQLYSWDKLKQQNELIKQLIHNQFNYVIYMDVYPSTVLRHDGHTTEDGLHYCIPGPIDNWVIFFYNILNLLYLKLSN